MSELLDSTATRRAVWRDRLVAMLLEIQPELEAITLDEDTRLGEDLGLDSLALEELFSRLKAALPGPVPVIDWFNALEAGEGRAGVLLDLILAQEKPHGR